ncbi:alpha/beta hydrolase [Nonomuraea sp. B1E8]|uniref:alpha/beta hydrolase n=1 Tax=unclassified Nonomuraea TaxID=2593643 RepID=UPI00325EAC13
MFRNLALAGLVATGAFLLWPAPPGGRLVKIYGELKTADRVAVIVPGADTTVKTFDDGPGRPRVWAGLGANDWIRFVPKTKFGPLGFGTDPMSAAFGARVFEAGPGGHSDYFAPGSASLRNLTRIVLGRSEQVTG